MWTASQGSPRGRPRCAQFAAQCRTCHAFRKIGSHRGKATHPWPGVCAPRLQGGSLCAACMTATTATAYPSHFCPSEVAFKTLVSIAPSKLSSFSQFHYQSKCSSIDSLPCVRDTLPPPFHSPAPPPADMGCFSDICCLPLKCCEAVADCLVVIFCCPCRCCCGCPTTGTERQREMVRYG